MRARSRTLSFHKNWLYHELYLLDSLEIAEISYVTSLRTHFHYCYTIKFTAPEAVVRSALRA